MRLVDKLYPQLPIPLQNIACSVEGYRIKFRRYNSDFWRKLRVAQQNAHTPRDILLSQRDARAAAFVQHAALTVPYYSRLLRELGAEPGDFRELKDLATLPLLTKAQVQRSPEDFMSALVPASARVKMHTSGTTGAGLHFATTADALREQYAVWWRHLIDHDIPFGTWRASFGGRSVVPVEQHKPPFWRFDQVGRQILFSAYHANPEHLVHYVRALRTHRPLWWHGYPSQIALLASYVIEHGIELGFSPRWITTSSESLLPAQETKIRQAFGAIPIQNYGMTEAAASISQCRSGQLHIDEDFAAVELVRAQDKDLYSVVGTNFTNLATPFIRYEVGDLVSISTVQCACGRPGRTVANIDGRQEAYIELANGVRVGRLDHIFKDMINVREAQLRQSRVGELEILVVKGEHFDSADEHTLLSELSIRLGSELRVRIQYVGEIPRTSSGKLRFVVSTLDRNALS